MPPRRRKPTQTRKTAAPKTRCRSITSISQFNAALEKGGTKKVVFVQFYQTSMWACKQLRPIFSRYSALPSFKNGIFVEIDTDEYGVRVFMPQSWYLDSLSETCPLDS